MDPSELFVLLLYQQLQVIQQEESTTRAINDWNSLPNYHVVNAARHFMILKISLDYFVV